jgi:hypothetical protein
MYLYRRHYINISVLPSKIMWFTPSVSNYLPFFYLVCEAIGIAATPGLLCQPRVIVKMIVEKQMECRLTGETEVLWENLPQRHFCPSQNATRPDPDLNPGRRGGKPANHNINLTVQFDKIYTHCINFSAQFQSLTSSKDFQKWNWYTN